MIYLKKHQRFSDDERYQLKPWQVIKIEDLLKVFEDDANCLRHVLEEILQE